MTFATPTVRSRSELDHIVESALSSVPYVRHVVDNDKTVVSIHMDKRTGIEDVFAALRRLFIAGADLKPYFTHVEGA